MAGTPGDTGRLTWARADLGFVAAYVLARGSEAAIVDTLAGVGLNYVNVAHVFLTHPHGDHAGSIGAVMAMATDANDSARRLAGLSFDTLLAGHGEPVEDMADTTVAAMAASL